MKSRYRTEKDKIKRQRNGEMPRSVTEADGWRDRKWLRDIKRVGARHQRGRKKKKRKRENNITTFSEVFPCFFFVCFCSFCFL